MDMEMEQRMMGCQIPAFGVWNYCSDLPITQYFDLAMQARLLKRHRRCCDAGGGERRLVLFGASPSPRKPPQIKVIRREVGEKQSDGGELLRELDGGMGGRVASDSATKRVAAAGAVDEDLYKVPRPLVYQKPRKVVRGCLQTTLLYSFLPCND
ncbi:unnamed protein product [Triticum turgidum subsp. durum]|uniref:Uncharacterized protein n=1 Tax=Triticum turgidum subsp. durum TaxID=4567 RepID=A0A9R1A3Q9_TRITD|nr:unnamed protein product [Triticum turgidum subsp. durum]